MALRTDDSKTLTETLDALKEAVLAPRGMLTIGPQQITVIGPAPGGGDYVTVTYPVGSDTVLSVQPPEGLFETRPAGTCGPYETGLRQASLGRIVYAPQGPGGPTFILPYSDVIPNM